MYLARDPGARTFLSARPQHHQASCKLCPIVHLHTTPRNAARTLLPGSAGNIPSGQECPRSLSLDLSHFTLKSQIVLWSILLLLALGRSAAGAQEPPQWNPREAALEALVEALPGILERQDPATGRFGTEPWICDDQNVIFPLAVAWATADPANPYYHDARVLRAIMKGGDALVAAQDKRGMWEFRKKDNSTWGQTAQPWTYSRWVRAFYLVKDTMPAKRREHWENGLKLGFERIARSLTNTDSHNKPCHLAMALYCAGLSFEREDWKQTSAAFMAKVVAAQSPNGYWSEHSGPVVNYNFVYVDALGAYYAMSRDASVLEPLRRAALFHALFTYPDGTVVETIDERNPYRTDVRPGNVGFSLTPEGRAFLARQALVSKDKLDADLAASFILHGETGPTAATPAVNDFMTSFGNNQALVWRNKPWFVCLSGFVSEQATNRWIQDRQNFVSIFHERAGLIVGGGNTKLQPFWSTFTVGNTDLLRHTPGDQQPVFTPKAGLIHIPSSTRLQTDPVEPKLALTYGAAQCQIAVRPLDDHRITLVCEAPGKTAKSVEAHVTFLPAPNIRLRSAAGKSVLLGEAPLQWSEDLIGSWFQYGNVKVTVPPGAKLLWPMKRHNPYKKDGSSTLSDARLVLCLPFSPSVSKQALTLEVLW